MPPDALEGAPRKLSEAEGVKTRSRYLRGTIADGIAADSTHFDGGDANLLKFHGTYQQYDRDTATERKQGGQEKAFQMMVRVKMPGGRLTSAQYLALDALSDAYGNGTLRVTTRQGIQFHGILKDNLKPTIAEINVSLLTTLGACGDVVRNVMSTPAPIADAPHRRLQADAELLSRHLAPRSNAYHEIWLDGEPVTAPEDEPLYGKTYLPRKFKIAIATPDDNSVDVLANDLGIIALFEGDTLVGYNLALGGGLGMTHNKPGTYPRLATPTIFVPPERLIPAVEAVVALQRDHGNRSDRKRARLKYLMDDKGLPWVKAELEQRLGGPLEDPRPAPRLRVKDHLGWHEQGDGRWYLGIPIRSGRIADWPGQRLRTALRQVIGEWDIDPIMTPGQDILLSNIAAGDREAIEGALREEGVILAADMTAFDRWALACPALPTCGLALAESERIRDDVVAQVEAVLARHGLAEEKMSFRMTGCPNGCARPYTGDIGIVGRMPGYHAVFVGGDFEGTRLSFKLIDRVSEAELAGKLEPLFAWFAAERTDGEGFGDFCWRQGKDALAARLDAAKHVHAAPPPVVGLAATV